MPSPNRRTIGLVPRSEAALDFIVQETGDNFTDAINRAVQLYAFVTKTEKDGKLIFIEHPATGERERLVLL